ncbi:acyltransferase family protein [Streptomyces sp. NPDC048172]|uniref:acyltransferase family protein n=1 Tax=Streptomyces sp. NPDC048172 TaxID=3365505 RepID=UPI003720AFB7
MRFFSGTLVVIGHTIEPLGHIDGLRWLYLTSWALRVPVFVLLAGYFSSAGPLTARELRRLSESVLLPYFAIGLLHTAQLRLMYEKWSIFVTEPAWGLWFLFALFVWRMLLPYVVVLRFPLLTAGLAAVAVGMMSSFGNAYSASRIVCFLPFFLLGWKLRNGLEEPLLEARWSRYAALGVLAATAVAAWVFRHDVNLSWLAMRTPYAEMDTPGPPWAPLVVRAVVLAGGGVVALAFVRLMPRRRIPVISYLGAGGLYIYLLHPLMLRPLTAYGDFLGKVGPWHEQLALLAVVTVLSAALASPPVRKVAWPLVQPRLPWLYADARRHGRHGAPPPGLPRVPAPTPSVPAPPNEETLELALISPGPPKDT